MKRFAYVVAAILLAALTVWVGCETESAAARLFITPGSASVRKNHSVTLTAHGGFDYEWSLENETWGTLSSRRGNPVVYRSRYGPGDCIDCPDDPEIMQTVQVTSYIDGLGTSNEVKTATALIMHVGFGLEIIPSTVELRKGESVAFQAINGEDYRWSLQQDSTTGAGTPDGWGVLSTRTGNTTVYTSLYDPSECAANCPEHDIQWIQLTSSDGGVVRGYIVHKPSGNTLSISPVSQTLTTVGDSVRLTASGGGTEYTWDMGGPYTRFSKSPATGRTIDVIYVDEPAGTNAVVVPVRVHSDGNIGQAYLVLQP